MKYSRDESFKSTGATAISIGKFDGLHLGHQKLLDRLKARQSQGLQSLVFTFQTPPAALLQATAPRMLITNEERCDLLAAYGVDILVEYPFSERVSHIEPEQFVTEILIGQMQMKYLAVGPDFRFGYRQRGDIRLLEQLAKQYDFQLEVVSKQQYQGTDISSTYIKEELQQGRIEPVNTMLGRAFSISGVVRHGRRLGRTLDIPTINQMPDTRKLLPPNGVYASVTEVADYEGGTLRLPGITNIGYKPSVGADDRKGVETHLFDFAGDLYGKSARVELFTYERPEQKFASVEELKKQMQADVEFGRKYFREKR